MCALGVILGVVAHGVELLRSWRGCGVSAHGVVVATDCGGVRPAYQGIKYYIYIRY